MNVLAKEPQKWLFLVVIILSAYLVYLLTPILTPFLVSAFLAYLVDPIVDKLQQLNFSRTLAVVCVFGVMLITGICLLFIALPLVETQINQLIVRFPAMIDWLQTVLLPWLSQRFGFDPSTISFEILAHEALLENWKTLGNIAGQFLMHISTSGELVLLWGSYILLIPVVTFYLLRDWDILIAKIAQLMPQKYSATVTKLAKECDLVLAEFLRGQLLVMLLLGLFYSAALWLTGLEFSLLIGVTIGLISFIPYFGCIVGLGIAIITALIQFHDVIHIVYILAIFGLGQAFDSMVLSPLLLGDRIGLHPVAVIFSVMAGAQLFGFFGMLIALPAAAMVTVILRHVKGQYLNSNLYTQ